MPSTYAAAALMRYPARARMRLQLEPPKPKELLSTRVERRAAILAQVLHRQGRVDLPGADAAGHEPVRSASAQMTASSAPAAPSV